MNTGVYIGKELGQYGFGDNHPFGPDRYDAFYKQYLEDHLNQQVVELPPKLADPKDITRFHTDEYHQRVIKQSATGGGYLDGGDTPCPLNIYHHSRHVVGSVLDGIDRIMNQEINRAFVPIAGLHHARRDSAAGFCVLNDCGIAIHYLLEKYQLERVAYIDIDVHHGDGVFYAFEDNPKVIFVDIHEDGQYLYPGTGHFTEMGKGEANGKKMNIPLPPGANDAMFKKIWGKIATFLSEIAHRPQFILFQCGADGLMGDPLAHLSYSSQTHHYAATELCKLADQYADGRILAMGGGGYNRTNLALAWSQVIRAFVES